MIRTDEAVLADLVASDDVAVAAALSEIRSSERPITGAVREVVDRIARNHASPSMREKAQAVIAVADASSRINRVRKTWGATLNPLLLASILRNPSVAVRHKALETIRSRDPKPFGEVVAKRLFEEPEPAILMLMLEVVGRTRDRGLMMFVDPIVDRPDQAVSLAALEALLALAGDELGPMLQDRLAKLTAGHSCPDVRFLARRTLAAKRGPTEPAAAGAATAAHEELTPASFTAALAHPSSDARLSALERATASRDRGLAGPIAAALFAEKDARVLAQMVSALRDLGDEEHADAVKPLLRHPDDRVCANAVETLVRVSGQVSVETLLPLLARDDNRLKANLMLAMRERYQLQVAGYVRRMLRSPKFSFRISGLYCARFMDLPDIYSDVVSLVSDEQNPETLRAGLDWLADFGPPERATQDLADLALVRSESGAEIQRAQARLAKRAPAGATTSTATGASPAGTSESAPKLRTATGPSRPVPAALPPESGAASRTPTFPSRPVPTAQTDGAGSAPASRTGTAAAASQAIDRGRSSSTSGQWRSMTDPKPTPRTRPGTHPDGGPPSAEPTDWNKKLTEPRVLAGLMLSAAVVLISFVSSLFSDREEAPVTVATRARGQVKAKPATATLVQGVVTRVSGPPGSVEVDLRVRKRTYTLRWPTGDRPREGQEFQVGSLKVIAGADGVHRLTAEQIIPVAPR